MDNEFLETSQRPFPLPDGPWLMTQTWHHLLFCHWPVSSRILRKHVPSLLDIDLFDGTGWIGITPFKATNARLRGLPSLPFIHSFFEMNVRTYVTYKGTPGVYFFSLDASKRLPAWGGRIGAFLPYRHASMEMKEEGDTIHFRSSSKKEAFSVSYQKNAKDFFVPAEDSLAFWLYERYCFFTKKGSHLYRGDIHHDRWRVSETKALVHMNSMASFLPRSYFQNDPLVHLSKEKQALAWALTKVSS